MGLVIHNEKITPDIAKELVSICPFGAISYEDKLSIGAGCKMCKLCVKKGPAGAVTFEEKTKSVCDKSEWNGVAIFAEQRNGKIHPVSLELAGKARELAKVTGQKVLAVLIGHNIASCANELLQYGVMLYIPMTILPLKIL